MAYLHANKPQPLLHRDLTSYNILLDSNLSSIKVADFGLSHVKQDTEKTYGIGQTPWMAPEGLFSPLSTFLAYVLFSFASFARRSIHGEG